MKKEVYDDYLSHGFILSELSRTSKQPLRTRKTGNVCTDKTDGYNENTWYYSVPPSNILVIDVDVKNGRNGLASYELLLEDLGLEDWEVSQSVETGSGGFHVYVYCDKAVEGIQEKYPDIDFQGKRAVDTKCPAYGVAGGQTIRYNEQDYTYTLLQPKLVINTFTGIEQLLTHAKVHVPTIDDELGFSNLDDETDTEVVKVSVNGEKSIDEVRTILKYNDSDVDYDGGWMQTCSAIQRELGKTDEAYEVFREWSATSPRYNEEACLAKWDNVGDADNGWTMGSLIQNGREGKVKAYSKRLRLAETLEELDIFGEDDWLAYPSIKDEDVEPVAKLLKERTKSIGGSTLNIATARKKVRIEPEVQAEKVGEAEWLNNVVFVESFSSTKFYLIDTAERLSSEGVNGRLHSELSALRKEWNLKTLGVPMLVKMGAVKVCSNHEYNPEIADTVYKNHKGGVTLNTYDHSTRPKPALEYTEKGRELVKAFVYHLKVIMSEDEADVLLDWLAYCAQNFGKKVLWTPLIQSAEGLGKSIIGNVMINHVFGTANAGTVDSNVIVSPQTSWATSGVFRVLEEIKLAGHNRYEVLNQLKPFITNHTVSRVEKYEASSEVRNFTNFVAFTNFTDAIPVTADDRRWWVVFSRQNSILELEKEVKQDRFDYFEPLHELSRPNSKYGCEFHKFLLERDVSKFNPSFPPPSLHKARMRATEDSKTANLTELEHLLLVKSKGISEDVVSTRQIKNLMTTEMWDGVPMSDGDLTTLLRKLGFIKLPKPIKSKGDVHYVWFKRAGMADAEVREKFHESMKLETIDGFDNLDEL